MLHGTKPLPEPMLTHQCEVLCCIHWNKNVVILTKVSSLAAPDAVKLQHFHFSVPWDRFTGNHQEAHHQNFSNLMCNETLSFNVMSRVYIRSCFTYSETSVFNRPALKMFGNKLSPEPMTTYCQLYNQENISGKFESFSFYFPGKAVENSICKMMAILFVASVH